MANLGRYMIDNPEPPSAIEQLRGNVNRVGEFMLGQKMADIERRRKREEEMSMFREKAKIETEGKEATLNRILGVNPIAGELSSGQSTFKPKGFTYEGVNFERNPSEEERIDLRSSKLSDEIAKKELSSMATNLPKLDQALQSVDQLEQIYYHGATPDKNPLMSRITGVGDAMVAKAGFNPYLNSYINNSKAFAGLIAKGGFGEAGMLTNQDIQRVVAALPTSMSTPEEAKIGFAEIKRLLSAARERFERTKQGYLSGEMTSATPSNQPVFGGHTVDLKSKYGLE